MSTLVCLCACPDPDTAARLAATLVEERLAACANILPPMQSVYRWQGEVERAGEVMLLLKTTRARYPALEQRLAGLHPYEVPGLVAIDAAHGLPAYLQWVEDQVRPVN